MVDLTGYYGPVFHEDQEERIPGPDAGDYAGLPINAANRLRGDTWNGSYITLPERQCIPHSANYGTRGVGALHITDFRDPATQALVKYETTIVAYTAHRDIWMDGRPHPPANAPHSFQGFSTGAWDGDQLVVTTTHLKPSYIRRNGLVASDRATLTERFIRHGDVLNHVMMIEDPIYLAEPLVKTTVYRIMAAPAMNAYPCRPAVEIPRARGLIPHNDWGDQGASAEYADRHHLPLEAVRGGPETALPEFMDRPAQAQTPTKGAARR
jgi:hypothetical protein